MDRDPMLMRLDACYQAMPPVAAMRMRIAAYDGARLRLHAPLACHVNDKGCAFGGSLSSLMTLASWGLVTLRLEEAGLHAEVYVADSAVSFRAPVFSDLEAEAQLAEDASWDAFTRQLRDDGRARTLLNACVRLPGGGAAATCKARYVAIAKRYDAG
ncbi:MAG: YiiD C-terminal domain-containing protein [Luteimonas sp.]